MAGLWSNLVRAVEIVLPGWATSDPEPAPARPVDDSMVGRAAEVLRDRPGAVLVRADGPDRPDATLIDRRAGLVAIDVDLDAIAGDRAPFVAQNRKRAELRELVGDLATVGTALVLAATVEDAASTTTVLRPSDLTDPGWPDRLPLRPLDDATHRALVDRLAPAVVFARRASLSLEARRLQLDAAQVAVAMEPVADVAVITGPPGSGKTLLLAARARHLARAHPDWSVAVVVFNRALVPYLTRLIDEPSVTVATVGRFAHRHGQRILFEGGAAAAAVLAQQRERGITPTVDALLVDEVQDMDPAWLHLLLDMLRPGRGGAMFVGDPAQSLYRSHDLGAVLAGRDVTHRRMVLPYRSTGPILRAAAILAGTPIEGADRAPDGEPVELIRLASRTELGSCVAARVEALIVAGRSPGEIAVLITQRRGAAHRLREALTAAGVPFELVDRTNNDRFDPATPTVKVLTVHGAKGHEFPVVVLVGVDLLPDEGDADAPETDRGPVAFVGATRAAELLLIIYTRETARLRALIAPNPAVRSSTWSATGR